MIRNAFQAPSSYAPLVLRLILGGVVWVHGAQKLLAWFGGYVFWGTMDYFTQAMGLPWIIGFLVIFIEFFGAIALIFGFATRIISGAFFVLAIGIIFTSHLPHGFFMNWFGIQEGEGIEYFLLWIGIALALMVEGGGKFSLDAMVHRSFDKNKLPKRD